MSVFVLDAVLKALSSCAANVASNAVFYAMQVRIKSLCVLSVCFRNVRGIVVFDRSRHFRINQLLREP
jgi:hypothetical protein